MAGKRKRGRLSRSGDFDRVYREGRSHSNRFLVLYSFARASDLPGDTRLGISASRKVGGAVQRNGVKRALREAFRHHAGKLPGGHDYVLVARPDITGLIDREGAAGVERALGELLEDADLRVTRETAASRDGA